MPHFQHPYLFVRIRAPRRIYSTLRSMIRSEFGAIEVEHHGTLWAILCAFGPNKLCVRIDETPNQPGRGHSIDPQVLARRPGASTIFLVVARKNSAVRRMRFVGREARVDRRKAFAASMDRRNTRPAPRSVAWRERRIRRLDRRCPISSLFRAPRLDPNSNEYNVNEICQW
jgi:hypothetical protein